MSSFSLKKVDFAILGAGIIGLESARLLAEKGFSVALIDRGPPAREASWAAAGILVNRGARKYANDSRKIYCESIRYYPEWIEKLCAQSGLTVDLHKTGDYLFLFDENAEEKILRHLREEEACPYEVLEGCPPGLSLKTRPNVSKIIYFPEEMAVNNRMLLDALQKVVATSTKISTHYESGDLTVKPNEHSVSLESPVFGSLECSHLCLCSGAWSKLILDQLGFRSSMRPVRGEVYLIPKFYSGEAMVHLDDQHYLVPRGQQLLVGGTSEQGVWEKGIKTENRLLLEKAFQKLYPNFKIPQNAPSWSGIRPKTRDTHPFIGYLTNNKTISINSGHFRSGISMAPLSCHFYTEGLQKGEMPQELNGLNPFRKKAISSN